MKYKGFNFRRTKLHVTLPKEYNVNGNYVTFGKICTKETEGSVKTNRNHLIDNKFGKKGEPVYAVPLECSGHSLTNLMYSNKNVFLAESNKIYMAKLHG